MQGFLEKERDWEEPADESEKNHRNCLFWFLLLPVLDVASCEKNLQIDYVSKIDI